jgi:hypothetical protein
VTQAALKKNAETAKKAQATRQANKAAQQALSVSTSGHSEVQHVSSATLGAQSPQVPSRMSYTMQTPTHLSSLSAPVSSGAPKVQTPHQQSSSGVYAMPSTTTQQHLHRVPPSRSAPDHGLLMDELNSPLIPLSNDFSGQSIFGPRETSSALSPQTPFHLHSLRIPTGQSQAHTSHENSMVNPHLHNPF